MKVRRKDGDVFEMECVSYGRGEWGYRLVRTKDGHVNDMGSDPSYRTERECRKAARDFALRATYHRGLGWCI